MQHKLTFLFAALILLSLAIAPASPADAQAGRQASGSARVNTPNPVFCPVAGEQPVNVFFDNMESGNENWAYAAATGSISDWGIVSPGISSLHSLSGPSQNLENDSHAAMNVDVVLPSGISYLYFTHQFDFEILEDDPAYGYDGGVLEYSADQGGTWQDAQPLFSDGQNYNRTLYDFNYGNPLQGRPAFSGNSLGAVSSRYDLSSLAGDSIRFRWRTGTDYNVNSNTGWQVDDVGIYKCASNAGVDGVAAFDALLFSGPPAGNAGVGLHYTNYGTAATGVILTVTLDGNLTYVSDTSGVVPTVIGNTVTWNLPDMLHLGGQDFTLYVGIPSGATIGTRYPISLSLALNESDINPGNNTDSAEALVAPRQIFLPLIMR